jgi:hypothetical protein
MEWLALSIAFVATLYFSVHFPGFRRGVCFVLVALIMLASAGGAYFWFDAKRADAQRDAASKLISPKQILLTDAKLKPEPYSGITGAVLNKSSHALKEIEIQILLADCPASTDDPSASGCTVVADETANISVEIPAGQKRAFDKYLSLTNLPSITGYLIFRVQVLRAIAKI